MKPGSGTAVKTFCLLVVAQAVCLGLGLWLESRFAGAIGQQVLASTTDASSQSALKAMAFLWIAALQAVVAYLILSRVSTEVSRRENRAVDESFRRQNDLLRTRDAVIFGLAKLAESRDPETGNHLERISLYATQMAKALRRHPRYRDHIPVSFVTLIGISSALHDIGKVGIQDSILLKPGKLTDEERRQMQAHSEIGGRCVRDIERRLGGSNFLQMARQIAFAHHERWDGSGYPNGLIGESIPLAARIVAIADVYDALTCRRVYKKAYSHERSVAMIRDGAGSQFDPGLVNVFLRIQNEFREIARRCGSLTESDDETLGHINTAESATDDSDLIPLPETSPSPIQTPSFSTY